MNLLQKQRRLEIAKDMLDIVSEYPTSFKRIITGGKTWVYEYSENSKFDKNTEGQRSRDL